jgi:hypothetical protein
MPDSLEFMATDVDLQAWIRKLQFYEQNCWVTLGRVSKDVLQDLSIKSYGQKHDANPSHYVHITTTLFDFIFKKSRTFIQAC